MNEPFHVAENEIRRRTPQRLGVSVEDSEGGVRVSVPCILGVVHVASEIEGSVEADRIGIDGRDVVDIDSGLDGVSAPYLGKVVHNRERIVRPAVREAPLDLEIGRPGDAAECRVGDQVERVIRRVELARCKTGGIALVPLQIRRIRGDCAGPPRCADIQFID